MEEKQFWARAVLRSFEKKNKQKQISWCILSPGSIWAEGEITCGDSTFALRLFETGFLSHFMRKCSICNMGQLGAREGICCLNHTVSCKDDTIGTRSPDAQSKGPSIVMPLWWVTLWETHTLIAQEETKTATAETVTITTVQYALTMAKPFVRKLV